MEKTNKFYEYYYEIKTKNGIHRRLLKKVKKYNATQFAKFCTEKENLIYAIAREKTYKDKSIYYNILDSYYKTIIY